MKVLFVAPRLISNLYTPPMPMGLLSIATYLQNRGVEVKITDRATKPVSIKKVVKEFAPDVVGVSVISPKTLSDAVKISKKIKKMGIRVVWGGPFASSVCDTILKENYVDYIIRGEGEETWNEFLQHLERGESPDSIDGLAYKNGDTVIVNKDRELLRGEDLPLMDYSLIDTEAYVVPYYGCQRMLWVCSAKGCPNQCTFCYNKAYHHRRYRKRPLDNVISEIRTLVEDYGADGIHFTDELWCRSSAEMKENCDKMKSLGLDFTWACYASAGFLTQDDFKYMYDSGCRAIFFGIESGSPERLKKIKKNLKFEDIERTSRDCDAAGISPWHSFIIGYPGETEEELKMTVDLGRKLSRYGRVQFGCFIPYTGSELYDDLVESGKLQVPSKLKGYFEKSQFFWDSVPANYSDVPTIDLKVVAAYANLWSVLPFYLFKDKTKRKVNIFSFVKSVIVGAIKTIKRNGWSFCSSSFVSYAVFILSSLFYAVFYPKVGKKYGLSLNELFK